MSNDVPHYLTVKQFAKKHPAFSEGSIRDLVFHRPFNGLDDMGVIHRVGAKVLIDEVKFFQWVSTNPSSTGRTRKGVYNVKKRKIRDWHHGFRIQTVQ